MASEKQYTDLYRECRNQIFAHSADVMNAVRDAAFADFDTKGGALQIHLHGQALRA